MTSITITDNIWATVDGGIDDVDRLLRYKMPGFQFSPAGKRGWDGWVNLGKWDGMSLVIPAGLVPYVKGQHWAKAWTVIDQRDVPVFKPLYSDVELGDLEPHQLEAVEKAIAAGRGVVRYPTGVGKGRILGEVIRRLGLRTLVIVDKKDLVKQLGDEIELCIGVKVGRLGGGKHEFKDCTVATYQSLSQRRDWVAGFWEQWDAVLVDEGHHTEAKTFGQTLQMLGNAYYRLGFSATPFKGGENTLHDPTYLKVQAWLGPPVATMSLSEGIDTGRIVPADIFIVQMPPPVGLGFKRLNYSDDMPPRPYWRCSEHGRLTSAEGCECPENYLQDYEASVVDNAGRNDAIIRLARVLRDVGPTVVICKRIEHGNTLADGIDCRFMHGGTKERQDGYAAFKQGFESCLVLSSIADEALDLPNIEYLILAGGGNADHVQIQRIGRGMRASAGKDRVTVFDFDDGGYHVGKHARRRKRLYESEPAYTAVEITLNELSDWGI